MRLSGGCSEKVLRTCEGFLVSYRQLQLIRVDLCAFSELRGGSAERFSQPSERSFWVAFWNASLVMVVQLDASGCVGVVTFSVLMFSCSVFASAR